MSQEEVAQTCFSRSAAFLADRAQEPRTYKTGPRYSLATRRGGAVRQVAQTCFSRSAAFLAARAQGPRTYRTGRRYSDEKLPARDEA
jgi:hypothetical protein